MKAKSIREELLPLVVDLKAVLTNKVMQFYNTAKCWLSGWCTFDGRVPEKV